MTTSTETVFFEAVACWRWGWHFSCVPLEVASTAAAAVWTGVSAGLVCGHGRVAPSAKPRGVVANVPARSVPPGPECRRRVQKVRCRISRVSCKDRPSSAGGEEGAQDTAPRGQGLVSSAVAYAQCAAEWYTVWSASRGSRQCSPANRHQRETLRHCTYGDGALAACRSASVMLAALAEQWEKSKPQDSLKML